VPPLRERREDIGPIAEYFLSVQNPELRFCKDAIEVLKEHAWPGNVRELRNVVVRTAVLAEGPEIGAEDLPEELRHARFSGDLQNLTHLGDLEREAIMQALEVSAGHQQRAADRLGISKRTLQRKIKSYGLIAERSISIAR